MKRIISFVGVVFIFGALGVTAQDTSDENQIYVLYRLTAENDKVQEFEQAWEDHNQKFHQESPVYAFYMESGPYSGTYQGVEGPMTWTEHENVEYTDAHGKDWLDNVQPLLVGTIDVEWWKHMNKYAQNESDTPTEMSIVTVYHIKSGEMARFTRMLDDWYEANTEQGFDGRYNVYQRQLHGQGQVAIVSSLDTGLAELDESSELRQRFITTHGEGTWQLFLDDYELSVSMSKVGLRNRLTDISTQQN
ncbi:hypothetical protein [Fodinibius salsisoli]|uniref:EthD domain-containing protein n=1 Tax=Fodinibius salsisoli TaxID=2820877 RepID=A0ABT3PKS4_9BACT|nr:hypothetical protein [Fodinibius salsisoli]MCW9706545.1 hypothetical protein [Fodinibius salsisoli]